VISFKSKSESATSVAIIVALLILVGTGLFMIFVKPPTTEGTAAGKIRSQGELEDRLEKLKADNTVFKTTIRDHTWPQKTEEIGPKALTFITAFAQKHRLKLMAFRPQKAVEVNNLTQLPFLISIEGPFPGVMNFARELEDPKLKLGTSMVQVSSNDPNSDLVSATIGVVAYKQFEVKKPQGKTNEAKKEN
jgi:hypothetical protein